MNIYKLTTQIKQINAALLLNIFFKKKKYFLSN